MLALMLLFAQWLTDAQQEPPWTWKDASGNIHTRADLDDILRRHNDWLLSESHFSAQTVGVRADLSRAHLEGARLDVVNLEQANLKEAYLDNATLEQSTLDRADLEGTQFDGANLKGVHLYKANLHEARFWGADLANADLQRSDLSDAVLGNARLSGSNFFAANLSRAWFGQSTLDRANFEPNSLPTVQGIAHAKNLESMTYHDDPDSLVRLRKEFEENGFREQERKITYALKRREAELSCARCTSRKLPGEEETRAVLWSSDSMAANCGSFILNHIFFDWTCQYGMSPGRPLLLGIFLWFLCSLLYFAFLHSSGATGLFRVYEQGLPEAPAQQRRVERISSSGGWQLRRRSRLLQSSLQEWSLLRASMFFSLMSAFNIGFRDINFGRWLRLLTRQEFDIKAVGWARVIAGWQSLISVYLIALWVLTYFGRPFG